MVNLLVLMLFITFSSVAQADKSVSLNASLTENPYVTFQKLGVDATKDFADTCENNRKEHLTVVNDDFLQKPVFSISSSELDCDIVSKKSGRYRTETKGSAPDLLVNSLNHSFVSTSFSMKFNLNGFEPALPTEAIKEFTHILQWGKPEYIDERSDNIGSDPRWRLSLYYKFIYITKTVPKTVKKNGFNVVINVSKKERALRKILQINRVKDSVGFGSPEFVNELSLDVTDTPYQWFQLNAYTVWDDPGYTAFDLFYLKKDANNNVIAESVLKIKNGNQHLIEYKDADNFDEVYWQSGTTLKFKFGIYGERDVKLPYKGGNILFSDVNYSINSL